MWSNHRDTSSQDKMEKCWNWESPIWIKQALKAWNNRFDKYFQAQGFYKCPHEHGLYAKITKNRDFLLACLYMDDLIFMENSPSMFEKFKQDMEKKFEMTEIGLMSYYLGIEVKQMTDEIQIS